MSIVCYCLLRCKDCSKVFKNADATSIRRHREGVHKEHRKYSNCNLSPTNRKKRRIHSALASSIQPIQMDSATTANHSKFLQLYKSCFPDHSEAKLVVLGADCFNPKNISICCRSEATAKSWQEKGFVAHTSDTFYTQIQPEGLIMVAVKPQILSTLVTDITAHWTLEAAKCVVVSIMAGVSLHKLAELDNHAIRMMPNMSCAIGQGTLITCASSHVPIQKVDLVVELGSSVGYSVHVDEKIFDAAASITGCGIAFIFMVIEALADGAVSNGVSRQLASKLSAEMVKGASQLFLAGDKHLAELKDEVCSPGGTTIAGVRELEKNGLRSAIIEAIHASTNRAQELAKLAENNMLEETCILPQKEEEEVIQKRKTRKRPRTKAVRFDLKNKLETAILGADPGILNLFVSQPDNTLKAALPDLLKHLLLDNLPEVRSLSNTALKSISNVTRVFLVTEEKDKTLWITINNTVCSSNEDKTVYVDNLPCTCTQDRLKRRAQMFGSVVSVVLPQIPRIQRAIGSSANSVFAFVQFASKTAAKRFCRRYATNSRLKRHTHKRKHASKVKKEVSIEGKISKVVKAVLENSNEKLESPSKHPRITLDGSDANTQMDVKEDGNNDKTETPPIVGTNMDDSGNETENDVSRLSKDKTKLDKSKKASHRRRRKRKSQPKDKSVKPATSLTRFLHRIQVFSLKQYKELRAEYIKLKKEKMGSLKKEIAKLGNQSGCPNLIKHADTSGEKKERKRRRGRQILELKAEYFKQASFTEKTVG
uniref:Pyrroline-5-carboxylate reductase n=1 Tax=Ditylenchus dipsaci TaxID=166011 RepID=A0A915DZL7_9BILA